MPSRRHFLASTLPAAALAQPAPPPAANVTATLPLDGAWLFRTGAGEGWQAPRLAATGWAEVQLPHTWQTTAALSGYLGPAWYRRRIFAPAAWRGAVVRVEFESVYHSATVWVNGRPAGEHLGKGYTAFTLDISGLLDYGAENTIAVRCDNSFSPTALPRSESYDWAPDGGIYRPVRLLVSPPVYVERLVIEATPSRVAASVVVRNAGAAAARVPLRYEIFDETAGTIVHSAAGAPAEVAAGASATLALPPATLANPRLWHFDHPHLYRLRVFAGAHEYEDTFGIRTFEIRGAQFFLNGEPVRLMGVERMAGSHPAYGMAEPTAWIEHDHRDMQNLNCVFTRVHWMQDRRVLDYCDRHGILMQLEVPAWGGRTFAGMKEEPSREILANGLEQLREMIEQNRNHPSVFAWGLCNEVNGQNPPAQQFIRALAREARRLDPSRPLTYASHSLNKTPERDVAGELDIIEWNEYFGSWYKGTVDDLRDALGRIRAAFPKKPIVVSEYGLCECAAGNPVGDDRRIEVLEAHNRLFREYPDVAGLIFFCYNDYRTHIGDKGAGALKQRVHGVVDLYGAHKPSYEVLRRESSPVESFSATLAGGAARVSLRTRATVPAYTLRGYTLRCTVYAYGGLPMEEHTAALPALAPGASHQAVFPIAEQKPARVVLDVLRPSGASCATTTVT